jgi:tetratricopeptide (TPR) repeat protein
VSRRICWALLLALAACATRSPAPATPNPTASIGTLAAAIEENARRSEHEPDAKMRGELAEQAGRDAQACLALEPQAVACLYGRAIAFGLNARAHPAHAGELLADMLASLSRAESVDPVYDEAGPARVRALVLLRAPGWPLGPGDAEAALAASQRAVALRPRYPPNLLALAEALAKTGDAGAAREAYERARDAALALPANDDRAEWLREADQGLQRR